MTAVENEADDQPSPGPGRYRCTICGGVFDKGWSDEEAAAELAENFPGFAKEECDLVCDDCFGLHFTHRTGTFDPDWKIDALRREIARLVEEHTQRLLDQLKREVLQVRPFAPQAPARPSMTALLGSTAIDRTRKDEELPK